MIQRQLVYVYQPVNCAFITLAIQRQRSNLAKLRRATAGVNEYQSICYHPLVAGKILTGSKLKYYLVYLRIHQGCHTMCVGIDWWYAIAPGFSPSQREQDSPTNR